MFLNQNMRISLVDNLKIEMGIIKKVVSIALLFLCLGRFWHFSTLEVA